MWYKTLYRGTSAWHAGQAESTYHTEDRATSLKTSRPYRRQVRNSLLLWEYSSAGERLPYKQRVVGSIPIAPTIE
jgi:hypothetical protein